MQDSGDARECVAQRGWSSHLNQFPSVLLFATIAAMLGCGFRPPLLLSPDIDGGLQESSHSDEGAIRDFRAWRDSVEAALHGGGRYLIGDDFLVVIERAGPEAHGTYYDQGRMVGEIYFNDDGSFEQRAFDPGTGQAIEIGHGSADSLQKTLVWDEDDNSDGIMDRRTQVTLDSAAGRKHWRLMRLAHDDEGRQLEIPVSEQDDSLATQLSLGPNTHVDKPCGHHGTPSPLSKSIYVDDSCQPWRGQIEKALEDTLGRQGAHNCLCKASPITCALQDFTIDHFGVQISCLSTGGGEAAYTTPCFSDSGALPVSVSVNFNVGNPHFGNKESQLLWDDYMLHELMHVGWDLGRSDHNDDDARMKDPLDHIYACVKFCVCNPDDSNAASNKACIECLPPSRKAECGLDTTTDVGTCPDSPIHAVEQKCFTNCCNFTEGGVMSQDLDDCTKEAPWPGAKTAYCYDGARSPCVDIMPIDEPYPDRCGFISRKYCDGKEETPPTYECTKSTNLFVLGRREYASQWACQPCDTSDTGLGRVDCGSALSFSIMDGIYHPDLVPDDMSKRWARRQFYDKDQQLDCQDKKACETFARGLP